MKYNPSVFLPEIRGSAGGTIFSYNRGGAYIKNNQTPVNPQSVRQLLMRGLLGGRSQAWRGLTQAQRDSWNNNASSFPYTDVFGNVHSLSGISLFNALNTALGNASQPFINTCPLPTTIVNFTAFSAALSTVAGTLTFAPSPTPSGASIGQSTLVYATIGLSQGIKNFDKYLRQITVLPAGTATGVSIFAAYVAKYGTPILGAKVGFALVPTHNVTGQQGLKWTSVTTVV